ncbi:hypothetical protein, partial [Glutamicibacter sp. NPDC087673]|uniref:hypothetical protein n=1 Tax=Glutamicibacter sp. NPDC087673 TaxID=3363997 RepID=UPI003818242A
ATARSRTSAGYFLGMVAIFLSKDSGIKSGTVHGVPEAIEMYEPHEVGFDTRHCRWDFPDAVISEYGSDLVGHYAHRIRHTRRDIYGITHDLDELLAALKRTLDDNQIQPIIEARESIGL